MDRSLFALLIVILGALAWIIFRRHDPAVRSSKIEREEQRVLQRERQRDLEILDRALEFGGVVFQPLAQMESLFDRLDPVTQRIVCALARDESQQTRVVHDIDADIARAARVDLSRPLVIQPEKRAE